MKERENGLPGWLYVVLVVLIVFFCCRFGWKIFGFSQCGAGYSIEQVEVLDGTVHLKGISSNRNFLGGFVGYTTKQVGNVLYVGIKYNTLLGILPTDKQVFDYRIPTIGTVEQVVLCAGDNQMTIWGEKNKDQMTVRVRVKGIYMDQLGYQVVYDGEPIAAGEIALSNSNDFILPFVFLKKDFPEDADMQKFALRFTLKGSEKEIAVKDEVYPGITFGQETEIVLQAAGEEVTATVLETAK